MPGLLHSVQRAGQLLPAIALARVKNIARQAGGMQPYEGRSGFRRGRHRRKGRALAHLHREMILMAVAAAEQVELHGAQPLEWDRGCPQPAQR